MRIEVFGGQEGEDRSQIIELLPGQSVTISSSLDNKIVITNSSFTSESDNNSPKTIKHPDLNYSSKLSESDHNLPELIKHSAFTFNPEHGTIKTEGSSPERLTPNESAVYKVLREKMHRVIGPEEFFDVLFPDTNPSLVTEKQLQESLKVYIRRLRKKFPKSGKPIFVNSDNDDHFIATFKEKGYMHYDPESPDFVLF